MRDIFRDLVIRLGRLLGQAILQLYPRQHVRGIRVVITIFEMPRTVYLSRLETAIDFLRENDHRRYRWLDRYVKSIVVWNGDYSFANDARSIFLSIGHMMDYSAPELAGVLVHETTHLRLKRMGIPSRLAIRARLESVCVRQQAEFLRLADYEELANLEERRLEVPWWTESDGGANDISSKATLPRWVTWVLKKRRERDLSY